MGSPPIDNKDRPIALFMPNFAGGGAERVMVNLAAKLAERGHRVDLLVGETKGPNFALVPDTVRVVDFKKPRVLKAIPDLVRYIRDNKPRCVLSALDHANVVAVVASRFPGCRVRTIVSEHNTLSMQTANAVSFRTKVIPAFMARTYPKADAVVACSTGVADDLAHEIGLARNRITVIYNPTISPRVLDGAKIAPNHPWFAPGEPPVIVAAGRLSDAKDFPSLLRAFKIVRAATPARLLILGEGDKRAKIEAVADELQLGDDFSLPGFVDNPYGYFSHAACYALTSIREGLPGGLIEALACGVPVVATNCPSGPDEILAQGKYGILCPVGDIEAIAAGILKVLRGEGIKPGPESWAPYTDEASVDRYEALILGGAK